MNSKKGLLVKIIEVIDQHRAEQRTVTVPQEPNRSNLLRFVRWFPTPGNILFTLLVAGLLVMTQQVWAVSNIASVPGASATTVNYQGRLENSSGNPLNGAQNLEFAIYDTDTGGNLIWGPESHTNVPINDGLFSVGLGSQTAGGISTTTWNGDRYLEITVNGETLTPRELIRSVPIAGMALTVPDRSITEEKLNVSVFKLLGHKTCDNCGNTVENVINGWIPVKAQDTNQIIEVTATTQGGPVFAQMTARYGTASNVGRFCGISVLQNNTEIRFVHLDGSFLEESEFACSGSWLFTDLPAGTYTFRAQGWISEATEVTWNSQRQMILYEFPLIQP